MTQAEQIFADVQVSYPDAEIAVREEKALTFSLGKKRIGGVWSTEHLLVSSLGVLHYDDDGTGWKDFRGIVKAESNDGFVFRTDIGGFALLFREDGSRRFYPRAEIVDEYVDIGVPEYLERSSWTPIVFDSYSVFDQSITYTRESTTRLVVHVNSRLMKVNIELLDDVVWRDVSRIRLPFELVGLNLDNTSLVSQKNDVPVSVIPAPYAIDSRNHDVHLDAVTISATGVEIDISLSKAAFPITIDPTLVVAIAGSGDDGWHNGSTFFDTGISAAFGSTAASGFFRYQVNLAQGTTILTAVVDGYSGGLYFGTPDPVVNIYACAEDNSAQITSVSDYNARALTTAFEPWTAAVSATPLVAVTTDDLAPVIQEVVSRAGFVANNFIQLMFLSSATGGEQRSFRTLDYNGGSHVSQLSIGYATAVPRVIPVVCV
jgi:hypothetical protein